jgi:hypothetical protein
MDGWTTLGELVVLFWHTKIDDVEVYLVCTLCTLNNSLIDLLGTAHSNDRRLPQCDGNLRSKYSHNEAEVSLPRSPPRLHPPLWASNHFLNRALQIIQPRIQALMYIQQLAGSESRYMS